MSKIDFSGLTSFIPEAVMDMKDLIKKEVFESKALIDKVSIWDKEMYQRKVGYMTHLGDIGVKGHASACDINTVVANVGTEEKEIRPRPFDTRLILCADEIANTIAVKAKNAGVNGTDLTDTEYMKFFIEALKEAMIKMYNRMIWLGDMGAAKFSASPAGVYSTAVDGDAGWNINLVNMAYGLFYRFHQIIAGDAGQRVSLAASNTQSSFALQKSTMTPAVALAAAEELTEEKTLDFNPENVKFGCTPYFWNALARNFKGIQLESQKTDLQKGIQSLEINGMTFEKIREWGYMIDRWQKSSTRWNNPHRVVSMRKDNLVVAVPSLTEWGIFEAWYEKKDRKMYIDIKDEFDTFVVQDKQLLYAY